MCFLFVHIFGYLVTWPNKTIFQYAALSNDRFIADDTVFDDNSEAKKGLLASRNLFSIKTNYSLLFTLLQLRRHSLKHCSKFLFSYSLSHSIQEHNSSVMFSPLLLYYRKRRNRSFGLISHCFGVIPVAVHLMETVSPKVQKSRKTFEIRSNFAVNETQI